MKNYAFGILLTTFLSIILLANNPQEGGYEEPPEFSPLTQMFINGTVNRIQLARGRYDAHLNSLNSDGTTPLTYLLQHNRAAAITLMAVILERSPDDINQVDGNGDTPLLVATYHRSTEDVFMLIRHGARSRPSDITRLLGPLTPLIAFLAFGVPTQLLRMPQ